MAQTVSCVWFSMLSGAEGIRASILSYSIEYSGNDFEVFLHAK